jgi:hypothetical protein
MKAKTCHLSPAALCWAVAKIEHPTHILVREPEPYAVQREYPYATDWGRSGPLIERENILFDSLPDKGHRAYFRDERGVPHGFMDCWYTTKLVTAMRCFVASKLGDEVDVPEELLA